MEQFRDGEVSVVFKFIKNYVNGLGMRYIRRAVGRLGRRARRRATRDVASGVLAIYEVLVGAVCVTK